MGHSQATIWQIHEIFDIFQNRRPAESKRTVSGLNWSPKMKFMVMVKATKDSEAGVMPSTELLTAMGNYNEELAKAGILRSGEGLHPSSKGARVRFSSEKRSVIDGPFAETKELVAGFWIWECKSLQEAIDWVKRCPHPHPGNDCEIEIRQVFAPEDFGAEFTPELREQEERVFTQSVSRQ
jgi:hypothetical protein